MPNLPSDNHPPNASNPPVRRQLFPKDKSENSHLAVAGYQFFRKLGEGGIGEAFLYQKTEDDTFWVLKKPSEGVAKLRNKLKALPLDFQAANEAMVVSNALKVKGVKPNRTVKHFNAINNGFGLPKAHVVTVAGINYMMAPYIGPEEKVSPGATLSYPKATLADYLAVQVRLAKTDGRIDEVRPVPRLTKALGSELCAAYSQAMQVILAFFRVDVLAALPEGIRNTVLDTLVKIAEKPGRDDKKKKKALETILALIKNPHFLRGLSAIANKQGWDAPKKKQAFQAVFALIQPKAKGLFSLPPEQINAFCQLLPLLVKYSGDPISRIEGHVVLFAQNVHKLDTLNERIKKYTARGTKNHKEGRVAALSKELGSSIPASQSFSEGVTHTRDRKRLHPPLTSAGVGSQEVGSANQPPPEAASSQVVEVAAAVTVVILLTAAEGVAVYFEATSALTSAFAPWIIAGQVVGGIALLALGYHVAHRPAEAETGPSATGLR